MNETLSKYEYGTAYNILEAILTQNVEDIELTDIIPPINDLTDSNKVFRGKLSILFVDMRKSTDLTDELKSKKMVKVYRSFIRMIVQAIRYCGGQSRQFAGDGVLGVFQDNSDPDNPVSSCERAVRAGRYILTLIDYCLNPQLKKHLGDTSIGCGVGICTGTVMATKVGMRGKEADDTAENEMGIVWVGSTTNYASRFCNLALPREIFIDENTYKGIAADTEHWEKETRVKGTKSFTGYLAKDYYLSLPDEIDIEPVISDETAKADTSFVQRIFDETEERALHLIDEISKKSAELSLKITQCEKKSSELDVREKKLTSREAYVKACDDDKEYSAVFSALKAMAVKFSSEQICSLGKDYWVEIIEKLEEINTKKGIYSFSGGENWYLSRIYLPLEMYWEYYICLCYMVEKDFSISEYQIPPVIKHIYSKERLLTALKKYTSTNRESEQRDEYLKIIESLEG